jgi:hypothetical protein
MSGACGPRASVPEPPPVPRGEVVPVHLIAELSRIRDYAAADSPVIARRLNELIVLVEERNAFGVAKYGQPLMTNDGRNGLEDARQELGDLLQYVCKCAMAGTGSNDEELASFIDLVATALFVMRQLVK